MSPFISEHEKMSLKGLLGQKIFWVWILLMIGVINLSTAGTARYAFMALAI